MSGDYYLDVVLKLRDDTQVSAFYFQGSIEHSLQNIFGEIGGLTELQVIKFNAAEKRAVIKVPESQYRKLRVALTLIGYFNDIPCHFHVSEAAKHALDI